MIADMMAIVPVRVWIFWIFVLMGLMLILFYRAFNMLRKDIMRLAQMILGKDR